ncbi:MAG: hypothetical protein WC612_04010 [Bdellovibrionales bacterium]|jgi:hypothetical protein
MEKEDYEDILGKFRILKEAMLKSAKYRESQVASGAAINAYANLTAVEAEVKGGAILAKDSQIEILKQASFVGSTENESHHGKAQNANAFANLVRAQISLGKLTP